MKIILPRKELRPYVRYHWMLESDEPFSVLTFPIGCPQIIFHRKSPLQIPELGKSQSHFTVSGQVNFPAHIQSCGHLDMIVTVFYPHTVGMFTGTPPSEFYNLEISGYDLENVELNDVAARVFDCKDAENAVGLLEQWMITKINPALNLWRTGNTITALMNDPSMSVSSLADSVCLSRKQFDRIFREHVGMNPKEYSRVVRFQKVLWSLQNGARNYADIAACCGYADQSHLIREFKAMSGHTPKSLTEYCIPYSDLFTCPA